MIHWPDLTFGPINLWNAPPMSTKQTEVQIDLFLPNDVPLARINTPYIEANLRLYEARAGQWERIGAFAVDGQITTERLISRLTLEIGRHFPELNLTPGVLCMVYKVPKVIYLVYQAPNAWSVFEGSF